METGAGETRTAGVHAIQVRPVSSKREKGLFVRLSWRLYRGDPNWVPPLLSDIHATVWGAGSWFQKAGPSQVFLAWPVRPVGRGSSGRGAPVGRIAVVIDRRLNERKGTKLAHLTLFETIEDYDVAEALFDAACSWARDQGMEDIRGPISPSNGDDYRALLVEGFDSPPVLMDSYNPPFYMDFFERYGFVKEADLWAFHYDIKNIPDRFERLADYAMRKFHFRVDPVDLSQMEREVRAIKEILDQAIPEEWYDMVPPTLDEVREMGMKLKPLAVPDFILIARAVEKAGAPQTGKGAVPDALGRPIGFLVGMPNYNQALKHLNGRLFPLGWLKFMWYRRRIDSGRIFILFVTPEYRKKGVTGAMFMKCLLAGKRLGYRWGEGSTIGETNTFMVRDAEGAGGRHYKTYRMYRRQLLPE